MINYTNNDKSSGIETFDNGDIYEGEFKDGEKHGKGKMTKNGETIKEGEWNMGTFYHGKIKYGPGFFYEGGFQNGLPHGKGKLTNPDGTFEEGMYWGGYLVLSTV